MSFLLFNNFFYLFLADPDLLIGLRVDELKFYLVILERDLARFVHDRVHLPLEHEISGVFLPHALCCFHACVLRLVRALIADLAGNIKKSIGLQPVRLLEAALALADEEGGVLDHILDRLIG